MRFLLLSVFLLPTILFGQFQLKGKVIDSKSKAVLPFVNIIAVGQKLGTTIAIDGKFTINSSTPITKMKLPEPEPSGY